MTFIMTAKRLIISACFILLAPSMWAAETPALVSTEWLSKHLSDEQLVIIDMSDGFQYQRFHIPGARHLPYSVLNRQTRQRVSYSVGPEMVARVMGQLGISPQHTVVIYDDTGGLNAARLYWELQRLQHNKVSILNGGLVKWIREVRKISWQTPKINPTSYEFKQASPDLLATKDDVATAKLLLDVRSKEEYLGHPRVPRSGHIPGARHFPWDSAVNFDQDFTMKPAASLKSSLARLGLTDPQQEVTLYCRSGHRAAHAFFTLRQLGWKKVRLYDGSMAEYEQDKAAALKKGPAP